MIGTVRCPRCRRAVADGAAFCPSCGAALGVEVAVEVSVEADRNDTGPTHEVVFAPGRRRGRVGVGVAVAVAVAVGASLAVGGGGGGGSAAPSTIARRTATTTAAASTTPPSAATTPSSRPTTTTTSVVVVSRTPAPLLGETTGLRVLLAADQGVFRLDLDAGTMTLVRTDGVTIGADALVAMRGGSLRWSNGELYAIVDDRPTGQVPSFPGQPLGVDLDGRAFALVYPSDGDQRPYVAVIDDAGALRRRLDLVLPADQFYPPAWPAGHGGLLVPASGGVFRWTAPGQPLQPVAAGVVIDVAGRFVLSRLCFPTPECRLTVTDLDAGAVASRPDASTTGFSGGRLSPDGRWFVRGPPIDYATGRVDTSKPLRVESMVDERVVELSLDIESPLHLDPFQGAGLAWSTDGRWLFYARGRHVLAAWRDGLTASIELAFPDLDLAGAMTVEWPA